MVEKSSLSVEQILATVRQTIAEHKMLAPGQRVLAAVSGGPDSVVLLHILLKLAGELDISLAVAHLNHCLRGNRSEKDALFVSRLASELGLHYFYHKTDVEALCKSERIGLEAAARTARYSFLGKVAARNGFDKIAIGHQADDNAEQVLMHLLRGSGPTGLAGIAPVREAIIRPLIRLHRDSILTWAKHHGLTYCQDNTNQDQRFTRNRIRHLLIPILEKKFNPNIKATLNRTAALMRQEQQWLEVLDENLAKTVILTVRTGCLELDAEVLAAMPPAQARRVLRHVLSGMQGVLRSISATHIQDLLQLAGHKKNGRQIHLPKGLRALRRGRVLKISTGAQQNTGNQHHWSFTITPGHGLESHLRLPDGGMLRFDPSSSSPHPDWRKAGLYEAYFDMDRLNMPLTVRNFRNGDRIMPFGMGGSQKLKKLFIDRKIPREKRPNVPLVLNQNDILWVAGIRRSSLAPVTKTTRRLLHISYQPPATCK